MNDIANLRHDQTRRHTNNNFQALTQYLNSKVLWTFIQFVT